jgi:release factor glutamine methyltransferase
LATRRPEAAAAARTLLDVVRLSTTYLAVHRSASPRLDAELLCAHALRLRRLDLYLQFDRMLDGGELSTMRELVRRRAAGEPVAYITGERGFYSRVFEVTPDVLVPRPETETLVERAVKRLRSAGDDGVRALDLGTGSGCIAVTLAVDCPGLRVTATDSSAAALEVAKRNAGRHAVAERIAFVATSWADGLEGAFDIVVSNPPYVTTDELAQAERDVRDHEPALALDGGSDGLDAYRALLASVRGHVQPGTCVLLEVDPRRANAVTDLLTQTFQGAACTITPDLAGHDRVVEAVLP